MKTLDEMFEFIVGKYAEELNQMKKENRILDFRIEADSTTGSVDMYIKPVKAVTFVDINLVISKDKNE